MSRNLTLAQPALSQPTVDQPAPPAPAPAAVPAIEQLDDLLLDLPEDSLSELWPEWLPKLLPDVPADVLAGLNDCQQEALVTILLEEKDILEDLEELRQQSLSQEVLSVIARHEAELKATVKRLLHQALTQSEDEIEPIDDWTGEFVGGPIAAGTEIRSLGVAIRNDLRRLRKAHCSSGSS